MKNYSFGQLYEKKVFAMTEINKIKKEIAFVANHYYYRKLTLKSIGCYIRKEFEESMLNYLCGNKILISPHSQLPICIPL